MGKPVRVQISPRAPLRGPHRSDLAVRALDLSLELSLSRCLPLALARSSRTAGPRPQRAACNPALMRPAWSSTGVWERNCSARALDFGDRQRSASRPSATWVAEESPRAQLAPAVPHHPATLSESRATNASNHRLDVLQSPAFAAARAARIRRTCEGANSAASLK